MAKSTGLGKGIGALITSMGEDSYRQGAVEVNINNIEPNTNQPRKSFDHDKIEQLAASIKEYGIIQPLIVKREGNIYKIIAGERRWRAARVAGLKTIPIIERDATSREIMEIALIENIQREDLNPIEEAEAYERLMHECNLTQEKLSEVVSKNRSTIANSLRLLGLSSEVRNYVISCQLSAGHARTILSLENRDFQVLAANKILEENLTVRETELYIKKVNMYGLHAKADTVKKQVNPDISSMQNRLRDALGTKVTFKDNNGKGKIQIDFYSIEDRERILQYLLNKE